MYGLGPLPYKPSQGLTEDLYNKAWQNQKATIKKALTSAMRFDRLGKRGVSTPYYTSVAYIRFMMHYANMISQRIAFLAERGDDIDLMAVREQYKIECMIKSLPCISNCKGVNLRKAFLQILADFGLSILAEDEIPFCPGIGQMVINSTLDNAFIVGGIQCNVDPFSEYEPEEYDNDEYTIDVNTI